VLDPGYPWWLPATVVVVILAALLWCYLGGWERPWLVTPLVVVMSPVFVLAVAIVAMTLSSALTELAGPSPPPSAQTEATNLATTPERTSLATTARPASPAASPTSSASSSATPSAPASASSGARTPP
jgi:hypothetical protein